MKNALLASRQELGCLLAGGGKREEERRSGTGLGMAAESHRTQSLVDQQVKDRVLSLLWLRSLLRQEFDPWPGASACHGHSPPKKQKNKKQKTELRAGSATVHSHDITS